MMKEYVKPCSGNLSDGGRNIVPAAAAAAALSVGSAFAVGIASGLMKDKGIQDSIHVPVLKKVNVIA